MDLETTHIKPQVLSFDNLFDRSLSSFESDPRTFFLLDGKIEKKQLDLASRSLDVELAIICSGTSRYLNIGTTSSGTSVEAIREVLKGESAQLFLHTHSTTIGAFMPVPSFQDIKIFKPFHGLHVVAVVRASMMRVK